MCINHTYIYIYAKKNYLNQVKDIIDTDVLFIKENLKGKCNVICLREDNTK